MKYQLIFILFLSVYMHDLVGQPVEKKILIFSKTRGFRHQSIEKGKTVLWDLCRTNGFTSDTSENSSWFRDDKLSEYAAVIFLNTTGDIFNEEEQEAFRNYIQKGGGFLGIHAATDTEYDWPWYGKLVGAYFKDHPEQQEAVVRFVNRDHPSTEMMPSEWKLYDEWYNFRNFNPDVRVLAFLDESSYKGGNMEGFHPIVWYHNFDGGKSFYTGFGHNDAVFENPLFLKHLLGGILYVTGTQ